MSAQNQGIMVSGVKWENDPVEENAIEYCDRSGNILKYRDFEGINTAFFFHLPALKQIKGFKFRQKDVYLPGYSRTGTHWTNEILCMLLKGKAETVLGLKPHIEIVPEDDLNKMPSPRVINAHMVMSKSPDDLKNKKCKVVFTLRDPKDIVVSMYRLTVGNPWSDIPYKGSFGDYLYMFLDGKVGFNGPFNHWRDAEMFFDQNPDIPVYYQVYEDAIKNPVESVQKLSDFLGLERDDELCKAIAEKCEFSKMKIDKEPHTLKIDGDTVLFRQGKAGDWKNYFSDEMLEDYYRVYDKKMAGSKFYQMYARK